MNAVDFARHRVLVCLFIDALEREGRWVDRARLHSEYATDVDERLFTSVVEGLRARGWATVYYDGPNDGVVTTVAMLDAFAHADALAEILRSLDARVFEADWQTRHIRTDAAGDVDLLIPRPAGWTVTLIARERPADPSPVATGAQIAGRDIYHFHGTVEGGGVHHGGGSESLWTRWGTIFGGASVVLAVIAIGAAWYFWRHA